jgi:hypothetical protein
MLRWAVKYKIYISHNIFYFWIQNIDLTVQCDLHIKICIEANFFIFLKDKNRYCWKSLAQYILYPSKNRKKFQEILNLVCKYILKWRLVERSDWFYKFENEKYDAKYKNILYFTTYRSITPEKKYKEV